MSDPAANPFRTSPTVAPKPGFGLGGLDDELRARNERVMEAFRNPPPKPRRSNALRIFVGGALDNVVGHNAQDYYQDYAAEVDGPATYRTHLEVLPIVDAIHHANAQGVPVDIIGHSYGATAAFNALNQAAQQGGHIRRLVTADPVGRLATTSGPLPKGAVEHWTNITASPEQGDFSDFVAAIGGKGARGSVPVQYADRNVVARRNHEEFAGMLRDAGVQSRMAAEDWTEPPLHDRLAVPVWMQQRNRQAGR